MKRNYLFISIALLSLLNSCSKKLEQLPPSNVTVENFYTNTNDFTQAVNGVYSRLRNYPNQALWLGELRSDNILASSDGNRDWQGINDFSPNLTTTAFIVNAWNNSFNAIYNANIVLDALALKGANIPNTLLRERFTAECRFLRAFFYFELVKYFGNVPIMDKAYTPEEVVKIPQSTAGQVYEFIIADLQYAAEHLPDAYTGGDIGRVTKWASKGILGLVYLTKSGPTYDIKGPGLNSQEYEKALQQFNDIITSNQYQFLTSFPSIFSYSNENNKEVVFDVQFMTTNNGAEFPSQLVPGAYWTGLGLSGYDNGYGTASYTITKNLLQSYKNSAGASVDSRDTFSIKRKFATSVSQPNNLDSSRPFLKKYIDVAKRGINRADWPINFIVMRYTDVLMMKAECILHGATGSQTYVDSVVNLVRTRAGAPLITGPVTLETLMEERRREFLGEGLRWNDLVREGLAVNTMNAWRISDGLTSIQPIGNNSILYPIPQAELLTTPGLYSPNPGYY